MFLRRLFIMWILYSHYEQFRGNSIIGKSMVIMDIVFDR